MKPSSHWASLACSCAGYALLASLSVIPIGGAAPAQEARGAPAGGTVKAVVDAHIAAGDMPNAVVAYGWRGGPTTVVAAGRTTQRPDSPLVDGDTIFRINSITKVFTGLAAIIAIEEGKLKLDQPISDFFPGYANMRILTSPETSLDSRPAHTQITVRHLLTHTSGLGYFTNTKGPYKQAIIDAGLVPSQYNRTIEAQTRPTRPSSVQAFAEKAATLPLQFEPGTQWKYSEGLDVLVAVIERAVGMPYEEYLATRLLNPLKMNSTGFQVSATDAKRLATSWERENGALVVEDDAEVSVFLDRPSFPYGGSGMVSTVNDLDRLMRMIQGGGILDGVRVMKPGSIALATSNLLPPGAVYPPGGANPLGDDPVSGFGAGGSVLLRGNADYGPGTYGWAGGMGPRLSVDPNGTRVVLLLNFRPSVKTTLRRDVLNAAAQETRAR